MPQPDSSDDDERHFQIRTSAEAHFAWIRTRLSIENTLMAWVRTATALIGFGFTIVQFFERLQQTPGVEPAMRPQMPRYLGLALIAAGVAGLVVSLWQYNSLLRYLRDGFKPIAGVPVVPNQTPLVAVTVALLLIGVVAFTAVLTRAV